MAVQSPIVPADLDAITSGLLACDALRELLNTREKVQTFLEWLLSNDSAGNLGSDFLLALSQQFLYDATKKGWLLETDDATGYLKLVQYLTLAKLSASGAAAGDYIVATGAGTALDPVVWVKQTPVYAAPSSGGTTIPAANAGGILTLAHGLSDVPKQRRCDLVCNSADANYAVDDVVNGESLLQMGAGGEVRSAIAMGADASNLFAVFMADGSNPKHYMLPDKSAFSLANIDPSKWDVFLWALP